MKTIIGIDVGKKGGFCIMRTPQDYDLYATKETHRVFHDDMKFDVIKICMFADLELKVMVIFENPFGYQSNGLNRAIGYLMTEFRFKEWLDDYDFTPPTSWKKNMHQLIPDMNGGTKKDDYERLIRDYLNDQTLTDDQCAAYGIAYWGWCKYNKESE